MHKAHKKAFNERQLRILKRIVRRNPQYSSIQIRQELSYFMNPTPSAPTIRRYLFRLGLKSFVARRKPLLTQTMKTKRLQWCRKFQNKPINFWDKIIFSDECRIDLFNYRGRQMVRRLSSDNPFQSQYLKKSVKHSPSIMIWGCFNAQGTGRLEIIDGILNSDDYLNILKDKMLPSADYFGIRNQFIFQDDSAPIHRAKKIKKWFAENNIEQLPWPANSPDLNPIENIWKILKHKVARANPKTIIELKKAIIRIYREEISPKICEDLVSSMQRRIQAVITNNGGQTKY